MILINNYNPVIESIAGLPVFTDWLFFLFFLSFLGVFGWRLFAEGILAGPENSGETHSYPVTVKPNQAFVFYVKFSHYRYLGCRIYSSVSWQSGRKRGLAWYYDDVLGKGESREVLFPVLRFEDDVEQYRISVTSAASRLAPSNVRYEIHVLGYELPEGWYAFAFWDDVIRPVLDSLSFQHISTDYGGRLRLRLLSPVDSFQEVSVLVRAAGKTMYSSTVELRSGEEKVIDFPPVEYGYLVVIPNTARGSGVGFLLVKPETPVSRAPPEEPPETTEPRPKPEAPPETRGPEPEPKFPSPWDAIKELLRRLLRDEEPVSIDPVVTKALIGVLFTVLTYTAGNLDYWVMNYGLIPGSLVLGVWHGLLTHFWLHSGWEHFISNALFLYVFGDNVEERFGYLRYLLFYLSAGVIAGLGFTAYQLSIGQPYVVAVGASGAVSGVMGAYAALFPRARLVVMGREVPAAVFVALWLIGQFALAFQQTTIGWFAHVIGLIYGALIGMLVARSGYGTG